MPIANQPLQDRAASDLTRGIHLELANRYASLARHREKLSIRF